MILSNDQQTAIAEIRKWFAKRERPLFHLHGYAGTGKTTSLFTSP
jgi:excinuclease UvrABC helicase subunit UvrB